jgi:HSP20 family molecular chaperone IbpA
MDLPDSTTDRLRTAREDLTQAQERWQDLVQTTCEVAGVDPSDAQIDLQNGVIRALGQDENADES